MGKIDIKRTELVWKGKYDEDGKLVPVDRPGPYPFQIVEVVNTPRIGHGAAPQGTLFETWKGDEATTYEDGWKNKLIWGDNKFVMSSLLEKFAGKVDLIYIDPPFATGADFTTDIEIGEKGKEVHKKHSVIEEKAYRDTWGQGSDSFLKMMYERIQIMKDLLSEKGSILVHLDYRMVSHIRLLMDEIFGAENYINEIIWHYRRWSNVARNFQKMHDTILFYAKAPNYNFNLLFQDYAKAEWIEETVRGFVDGKLVRLKDEDGNYIKREKENKGVPMHDVWEDINFVAPTASERLDYPTQKPEALLNRIIKSCSSEHDLVADFFCGSGTTCSVAEKLGRRWIGVDLGRFAIHTTRKRMLEIEYSKRLENENSEYGQRARSFEILNYYHYINSNLYLKC